MQLPVQSERRICGPDFSGETVSSSEDNSDIACSTPTTNIQGK